ncbi:hypothetical protein NP233_g6052 [Leucocoprinus birnbaumii]|uniref:Uncharacterized protein n=1 Tax=Leucocoprinus birnbaumii TaxID=56174 RepID=A0AAD5YQC8_9AGAR|nr:hypothetical protein NP233_g6052 [Leucocoprinus birnbaumii]
MKLQSGTSILYNYPKPRRSNRIRGSVRPPFLLNVLSKANPFVTRSQRAVILQLLHRCFKFQDLRKYKNAKMRSRLALHIRFYDRHRKPFLGNIDVAPLSVDARSSNTDDNGFDPFAFTVIGSSGYKIHQRLPTPRDAAKRYTLQEVMKLPGFELIPWDGKNDRPLVTTEGHVIGALIHAPEREDFHENARQCFNLIQKLGATLPPVHPHRRGTHKAIHMGVLHGGGSKVPVIIDNRTVDKMSVERTILDSEIITKHISHSSAALELWFPKQAVVCCENLLALLNHSGELAPNSYSSSFPTLTVNFDNVVCHKHLDDQNYPYSLCSIQPLGPFNPDEGGHLILWDMKRIIRFPPHTTILIPSALLMHSNVAIPEGQQRASIIQYAPAELFRYVENGFATDKYLSANKPELFAQKKKERMTLPEKGLNYFLTMDQLMEYPTTD